MSVRSICQSAVDTVRPMESVLTAAQRFASRCVGTLVVVDEEGRPIGMLTDRDITIRVVATGCDPRHTTVAEVMSGEVAVVHADEPVEDVVARMRRHVVRRMPVVDDRGGLVGIVSLEDVLALIAREMADVGAFVQEASPARLATS